MLMKWTGASLHGMQLEALLSSVCLCFWQRSTSLEVPVTAHECVSDVPSTRLSPSLVCTRRKRRSQSIPAELASPSTSPYSERPTGCTRGVEAGTANKVTWCHCLIGTTHVQEMWSKEDCSLISYFHHQLWKIKSVRMHFIFFKSPDFPVLAKVALITMSLLPTLAKLFKNCCPCPTYIWLTYICVYSGCGEHHHRSVQVVKPCIRI